jgi:hypothetical protein
MRILRTHVNATPSRSVRNNADTLAGDTGGRAPRHGVKGANEDNFVWHAKCGSRKAQAADLTVTVSPVLAAIVYPGNS